MKKTAAGIVSPSRYGYSLGQRIVCILGGKGSSNMYQDDRQMAKGEKGTIVGICSRDTQILLDDGTYIVRSEDRQWEYFKPLTEEIINNYSLY